MWTLDWGASAGNGHVNFNFRFITPRIILPMNTYVALDQERLKLSDQGLNEIHHLVERIKNQLAFGNLRLAERYIKSELKILVRLIVGNGGNVNDLIACYERDEAIFIEPNVHALSDIHPPFVHGSGNDEQKVVLVDNIELMEQPERLIESLVRLYRTDDVKRIWSDLLYFSITDGRLVLLGGISDWKVNALVGTPACRFNKLPHQVIQRSSEIVDGISDNQRNVIRNRFDTGNIKRSVLKFGYRMRLGSKCIGLSLNKNPDGGFQVADVLFGPFNFQSDSVDAALRTHAL